MAPATILKVTHADLQQWTVPAVAKITDANHLASYNWVGARDAPPTIVVPGCPALWSPPRNPRRLPPDSGFVYIAQNAARNPESPLEPCMRALFHTDSTFDIGSIDLVTDRNCMRKLLSFIMKDTDKAKAFEIDVEIVENTALFRRMEGATSEFIGKNKFRGFGREFENAYTKDQIEQSTGHHRIMSYNFGGLKCIVRYEADGFVRETKKIVSTSKIAKTKEIATNESTIDSLTSVLEGVSLSKSCEPTSTFTDSRLILVEGGETVAPDSIVEIKTKVHWKTIKLEETAPQLWLSQTPRIVRAYYSSSFGRADFRTPEVEDVSDAIAEWEADNQDNLRKLAALVKKIVLEVKKSSGNATITCDQNREMLVVLRKDNPKMLPKDLYQKWEEDKTGDEVSPTTHAHDADVDESSVPEVAPVDEAPKDRHSVEEPRVLPQRSEK